MRILFGWEFGAGLGHINRIKPIARALRERGAEIFLALQETERADAFWDPGTGKLPDGYHLLPIPRWNMPSDPKARTVPTHSFADVLNLIGYGNESGFAARLEAWNGLFSAVQPDLVVGDFSPTMNIAARGRIPSLTIGNGYTMPPGGRPMPPIRPWQDALEDFSKEHEANLLAIINKVLRLRGEEQLPYLSDAFHGDRSFPLTLSIVDPYAAHREEATVPPFNMPTDITPLPKDQRPADSVFFYMPHSHPLLKLAVDALKQSDLLVLAYISGISSDAAHKNSTDRFRISPTPLPFNEVMPKARLLVHHGGLSTAVAGTMAGTPQAILPWNLEHLVTAKRIETLGATRVLNNPAKELPGKALTQFFVRAARDDALLEKAIMAAGSVELGNPDEGLQAIVSACFELIGKNPG
ncbi:glycosyltransferase [Nisaea nitritireducens]|uniref:glycosyltransferase n=1 Tax=Nisaea nitritireducens TaxID=568392 RepID=UPI0018671709|nr:nucleotide disphospho-sugar-binding domain-containing protein [Nisaea nitritireducens]